MTECTSSFYYSFILSIVYYYYSDVIIQRNKLLIFRDLLKFTTKCVGAQIKTVSFLFCIATDAKS